MPQYASVAFRSLTPLITALLCGTAAAQDSSGIERCRQIADPVARLACYDALGKPAETRPGTAAPAPAAPAPAAPAPAAPAQAGAAAAPTKPTPEQFGLEYLTPEPKGLDKMEARVAGKFEGWWQNAKIALANGQVWQVADGSSRIYELDSPKVIITRGTFGAFYLNVDGQNWTVRVRRIQ
jgi:hypothetical protein